MPARSCRKPRNGATPVPGPTMMSGSDSFIAAHKEVIVPAIGHWAEVAPWTFAFGLFFASVLLYSQAATTRAAAARTHWVLCRHARFSAAARPR